MPIATIITITFIIILTHHDINILQVLPNVQ